MEKQRKETVLKYAKMTFSVLAQLPMVGDKKAREAGNLVYAYCKASACKTEEEENLWDSVFHNMMPLKDEDADFFMGMMEEETAKA